MCIKINEENEYLASTRYVVGTLNNNTTIYLMLMCNLGYFET